MINLQSFETQCSEIVYSLNSKRLSIGYETGVRVYHPYEEVWYKLYKTEMIYSTIKITR